MLTAVVSDGWYIRMLSCLCNDDCVCCRIVLVTSISIPMTVMNTHCQHDHQVDHEVTWCRRCIHSVDDAGHDCSDSITSNMKHSQSYVASHYTKNDTAPPMLKVQHTNATEQESPCVNVRHVCAL